MDTCFPYIAKWTKLILIKGTVLRPKEVPRNHQNPCKLTVSISKAWRLFRSDRVFLAKGSGWNRKKTVTNDCFYVAQWLDPWFSQAKWPMMSRFAVALVGGWIMACVALNHANASEPETVANEPTQISALKTLLEKNEDDGSATSKTATIRNSLRLERLCKPLTDVRIEATAGENKTPSSGAAELLAVQLSTTISSSGASIPQPDRYTISSCHRPLYFEELNLERCGNTYGVATNLVSGVHFLTNTAMLPYRLATQRPDCPVASHGDCQTCQEYANDIEPFGREPRGALAEAAAIAGFVFLLL